MVLLYSPTTQLSFTLINFIQGPKMNDYRSKIKNLLDLKKEINELRASAKKIVFTNGCFDILHAGHIRYLSAAAKLGDYLIIAVNSDRSVKSIKGPDRPMNMEADRAELLAALFCVDYVTIFDEDDPYNVINALVPDVLVKGGDWTKDRIIGADVVNKAGGLVKSIPFENGYSTTDLIHKIREIP